MAQTTSTNETQKPANTPALQAPIESDIEEAINTLQNPVARARALSLLRAMALINQNEANRHRDSNNHDDRTQNYLSNSSTINDKEETKYYGFGNELSNTIVDRTNIGMPFAALSDVSTAGKVAEHLDKKSNEPLAHGMIQNKTEQTAVSPGEIQPHASAQSSIPSVGVGQLLAAQSTAKDSVRATPIVTSNGLTAQFLRQVSKWSLAVKLQIRRINNASSNIPRLLQRVRESFATPTQREIAFNNLGHLFLIGVLAWLGESIVFYLLRPARQRLNEKALQAEHQQLAENGLNSHNLKHSDDRTNLLKSELANSKGIDDVGSVKNIHDRLLSDHDLEKNGLNEFDDSIDKPHLNNDQSYPKLSNFKKNETANRKLQRLRWAALNLAYYLIPLIFFFTIATVLMVFLLNESENDLDIYAAAQIGTSAYVSLRMVLALTQFLIAPKMPVLRLIDISNTTARFLYHWMIALMLIIAIAGAGNELAILTNLPVDFRTAWLKLAGLIVHCLLLIIVFQSRHKVTCRLTTHVKGIAAVIRNGLAKVWTGGVSSIIIAIWVIWAFGVEDGFQRLIHFIASTALLIIAARVLTLLIFAVLARLFENYEHKHNQLQNTSNNIHTSPFVGPNPLHTDSSTSIRRYHSLIKNGVSLIVGMVLVLALFENWGLSVIDWLTHKRVGQHFASAFAAITMAAFLAVIIWETINLLIEKRLRNWHLSGDRMRSARLRTLLPMLRTLLFIMIALLFGLTALNELGVNTTPLLAGASLVGVAIGLGSQKLIQDFATGIFLLMENSMQVGDWVTVAGVSGTVEHLSIRTVRLRALDGSVFTVPFSSVTTVNNVHRGIANASFRLSVAFSEDVERVSQLWHQITDEMRNDPLYANSILSDLDWWGVDQIDGSGIVILAQLQTCDADRWRVQREFNRRMLIQIRKLGIMVNNPQQRFIGNIDKQLNPI